jgi:Na+:H+ antiporter, NhaA family
VNEVTAQSVRAPLLGGDAQARRSNYAAVEAMGAIALAVAVAIAIAWSNSPWSHLYTQFWSHDLSVGAGSFAIAQSLNHWVNEGLLAIFFFVVGLELKREFVRGELQDRRAAALPIAAALGGMAIPAAIFIAINAGGPHLRAWAIPATTDTAFAVGFLALLGARVAPNAKVLLLSIAIVDDLGAILVIAFVYTPGIHLAWVGIALGVVCAIVGLRRVGVLRYELSYLPLGIVLWIAIFQAGFHATVAGVVLGLLTPAQPQRGRPVLDQLEQRLHPWASLVVVPLFALANAGVSLTPQNARAALSPIGVGIAVGLLVGKLVGIVAFSQLVLRARIACLPRGVDAADLIGVAAMAGVGFSVSLFVAELALDGAPLDSAKIAILIGSLASAALGSALLVRAARRRTRGARSSSPARRSSA